MTDKSDKTYLDHLLADGSLAEAYAEGSLLADVHTLISLAFEDSDLSYADVAERLGVSKARAHQLISGDANITVETMASLAAAFRCTWSVGLDDLDSGTSRFTLGPARCKHPAWVVLPGSDEPTTSEAEGAEWYTCMAEQS